MGGHKKDRSRNSRQHPDPCTVSRNPLPTTGETSKPATARPANKFGLIIITAIIGVLAGVLLSEPLKIILNPIFTRVFGKKDELKPSAPATRNQLPKQGPTRDPTAASPKQDDGTLPASTNPLRAAAVAQIFPSSAPPRDVVAIASRFYAEVRVQNTGDLTAIDAQISVEPPSEEFELELDRNGTRTEPSGWEHLLPARDAPSQEHPHVHLIDIDSLPPGFTLIFHYFVRSTKYFPTLQLAVKATAKDYKNLLHPTSSLTPLGTEPVMLASSESVPSPASLADTTGIEDFASATALDSAMDRTESQRSDQQASEAETSPDTTVLAISPKTGQQGQTNLYIAISGEFSHFVDGSSAELGSGMTTSIPDGSLTTVTAITSPTTVVATLAPVTVMYTNGQTGNLATVTDLQGNTTTYTYDAVGNLTSSTTAHRTIVALAGGGNLLLVTDSLGPTTTYAYDQLGTLTSWTHVQGQTYADNVLNRLSWTATAQQNVYFYDQANRSLSATNGLGDATTYAYDLAGNLVAVIDALGNLTPYASRVSVTNSFGHGMTFPYNDVHDRVVGIDEQGQIIIFTDESLARNRSIGMLGIDEYPIGSILRVIESGRGHLRCPYRGATDTSRTIGVTTIPSCVWTIAGSPEWIMITGGGSDVGNDAATLSISSSASVAARTGTLIVSGAPLVRVVSPVFADSDGDGLPDAMEVLSLEPPNEVQQFVVNLGWTPSLMSAGSSIGNTVPQSRSRHASPSIVSSDHGGAGLRVKILNHGGSQLTAQTRVLRDFNGDGAINCGDIGSVPSSPLNVSVLKEGGTHLSVTSTIAGVATRNDPPTTCATPALPRRAPREQPASVAPMSSLPITHKSTRN